MNNSILTQSLINILDCTPDIPFCMPDSALCTPDNATCTLDFGFSMMSNVSESLYVILYTNIYISGKVLYS